MARHSGARAFLAGAEVVIAYFRLVESIVSKHDHHGNGVEFCAAEVGAMRKEFLRRSFQRMDATSIKSSGRS